MESVRTLVGIVKDSKYRIPPEGPAAFFYGPFRQIYYSGCTPFIYLRLESPMSTAEPLEEFMLQANWEPRDFTSAAPCVEFENTNFLGAAKKYSRLWVPGDSNGWQRARVSR
jgi:hypothetical protein